MVCVVDQWVGQKLVANCVSDFVNILITYLKKTCGKTYNIFTFEEVEKYCEKLEAGWLVSR